MNKLTASEAIEKSKTALKAGDRRQAIETAFPDDSDTLPDWDKEPDTVFQEWNDLVDTVNRRYYEH